MTGDNWARPMYEAMTTVSVVVCAFFISFYVLTAWISVNILVAVILESFSENEESNSDREV